MVVVGSVGKDEQRFDQQVPDRCDPNLHGMHPGKDVRDDHKRSSLMRIGKDALKMLAVIACGKIVTSLGKFTYYQAQNPVEGWKD